MAEVRVEDDALVLPEDPQDAGLTPEERGYERVLSSLDGLERRLEESQSSRDGKIAGRLEAIGKIIDHLRREREGVLDEIVRSLVSSREQYVSGAERADDAFGDVGRKLDWLMDDSRELRRRVVPEGRAPSNLAAAFAGGAVTCVLLAGLAVGGGFVEVRWTPQVGQGTSASVVEGSIRSEGQVDGVRSERVSPEVVPPNAGTVRPPELGSVEEGPPVPVFGSPPTLREDGS